jgi:hypothetical protein
MGRAGGLGFYTEATSAVLWLCTEHPGNESSGHDALDLRIGVQPKP